MPTFHFNIMNTPATIVDIEGTDLVSLASAREEAILDARAMMSTAILEGHDISNRAIEICNDQGELLLTVAFKDAIIQ